MQKLFLYLSALVVFSSSAHALTVLDLNVFDQLQGKWDDGFRMRRTKALADYIKQKKPDIVVFQEAIGNLPGEQRGGEDSTDAAHLTKQYPHRTYIHEMTGADGASYGYWMGSKTKPRVWTEDGFHFPGGVARRVQAAIWDGSIGRNKECLGILSLHFSYQNSEVRQREAEWVLEWLKGQEKNCKQWLVVGDFNADREDKEMQMLFDGGLQPLFKKTQPTVGAYNPIRKIYGENIPSRTIDWALGWNLKGEASVVLRGPWRREWISDHAGVWVTLQ